MKTGWKADWQRGREVDSDRVRQVDRLQNAVEVTNDGVNRKEAEILFCERMYKS